MHPKLYQRTFKQRQAVLDDLATFARIEVEVGDIEPWAELIKGMNLDVEDAFWMVKLYNAYDDISSAWKVFQDWPSPEAWAESPDHHAATTYYLSRERRGLRGGIVLKHLDSYISCLAGMRQRDWVEQALGSDPLANFSLILGHLRQVWGVGRQTAFEWAEFLAKVLDCPIEPSDGQLWESSGPRESLERLYSTAAPTTLDWLNNVASECRGMLQRQGITLSWWDFETIICDFNVMRKGRYYPGKHIAMINGEIDSLGEEGAGLRALFRSIIPEGWCDLEHDKAWEVKYRDTGEILGEA